MKVGGAASGSVFVVVGAMVARCCWVADPANPRTVSADHSHRAGLIRPESCSTAASSSATAAPPGAGAETSYEEDCDLRLESTDNRSYVKLVDFAGDDDDLTDLTDLTKREKETVLATPNIFCGF